MSAARMKTLTISLHRFEQPTARLWAMAQMGAARLDLARMHDVLFWKLCGSGGDHGFTFRPDGRVWAILAVWPDYETARYRVETAPVYRRWAARASEDMTVFLQCTSTRGKWSKKHPFTPDATPHSGPLGVLTRASLKPKAMLRFWQKTPAVNTLIGENADVLFKVGLGEVPLLHQITFSIWPDTQSMTRFAHHSGAHAEAIKAVRDGQWFAEELYARFNVIGARGYWHGRPLFVQKELAA